MKVEFEKESIEALANKAGEVITKIISAKETQTKEVVALIADPLNRFCDLTEKISQFAIEVELKQAEEKLRLSTLEREMTLEERRIALEERKQRLRVKDLEIEERFNHKKKNDFRLQESEKPNREKNI